MRHILVTLVVVFSLQMLRHVPANAAPISAPRIAQARVRAAHQNSKPLARRLVQRGKQTAAVLGSFLGGTIVDGPRSTWRQVKQHKWAAAGTVVATAVVIHGVQYLAAQLGVPVTPAQIAAGMIALHAPHAIGDARKAYRAQGAKAAARSLGKSLGFPLATLGVLETIAASLGGHGSAESAAHGGHGKATGLASCLPGNGHAPAASQVASCTGRGAFTVAEQAHLAEIGATTTRALARGAGEAVAAGVEDAEAVGLLARLARMGPRFGRTLRFGLRGAIADIEAAPAATRLARDAVEDLGRARSSRLGK